MNILKMKLCSVVGIVLSCLLLIFLFVSLSHHHYIYHLQIIVQFCRVYSISILQVSAAASPASPSPSSSELVAVLLTSDPIPLFANFLLST